MPKEVFSNNQVYVHINLLLYVWKEQKTCKENAIACPLYLRQLLITTVRLLC